jgi:hypothetical protein
MHRTGFPRLFFLLATLLFTLGFVSLSHLPSVLGLFLSRLPTQFKDSITRGAAQQLLEHYTLLRTTGNGHTDNVQRQDSLCKNHDRHTRSIFSRTYKQSRVAAFSDYSR